MGLNPVPSSVFAVELRLFKLIFFEYNYVVRLDCFFDRHAIITLIEYEGEYQMNERIKNKLALLPDQPGCYLMKDKNGTIIYVGKAKILKIVSAHILLVAIIRKRNGLLVKSKTLNTSLQNRISKHCS